MKLIFASLAMLAAEATFVLLTTHTESAATRDLLWVGLLLATMLYLAYLVSIKRC